MLGAVHGWSHEIVEPCVDEDEVVRPHRFGRAHFGDEDPGACDEVAPGLDLSRLHPSAKTRGQRALELALGNAVDERVTLAQQAQDVDVRERLLRETHELEMLADQRQPLA
jgi:hypothetical protein